MMKIKQFIKDHKFEVVILGAILIIALALRLFRISEYLTFLGDEGRDVRIVRDLITKGNLIFIGPQTSIGNMYLGPLYYYMMAPALWLSNLNPVGPAIMVALLGVITIAITWYIAREWFGKNAAIVSALLFALSPVAIIYSRSSWNPNPMPFFALISIFCIYRVWKNGKINILPVLGFTFASALQMHYLGLLIAPTLFIFWLLTLRNLKKQPERVYFWKQTLIMVGVFLLMMSPLALFDIKHQGMNFNAFKSFFSDRQTTVNLNPVRSDRFIPVITQATSDLVLGRTESFSVPAFALLLAGSIFILLKSKNKKPLYLLYVWIAIGFLGLGVYKQHVYIHYLGFLYPAIYLLLGAVLGYLLESKIPLKILSGLVICYLVFINITNSPLYQSPNRQMQRTEAAVDKIIEESKDQPFNFALIAKQNYDESYRYFFENKNSKITPADKTVTDQLFVICEDGETCRPEGSDKYEIALFGIAKVTEQWSLDYLKIYKMSHY